MSHCLKMVAKMLLLAFMHLTCLVHIRHVFQAFGKVEASTTPGQLGMSVDGITI